MKICLYPSFGGEDQGDGGVRRVVEAQQRYLPSLGIELVGQPEGADLLAAHIQIPPAFLKRVPGIPVVLHCHGLYWAEYPWGGVEGRINQVILESMRQAQWITAPSEWVARSLRRHIAKPVRVINHGIDVEDWEIGENKGYVLWNKTRVDPVCDPDPLNTLAAMMPETQFVTTFGDEMPNMLVTDKLPYETAKVAIRQAGAYLSTTRETYGIGVLEALAAGVPVVGWRWGGQEEIIREGKNGKLVTPGDFEGLRDAVHWALENRDRLAEEIHKDAIRRHGWLPVMKEYKQLYELALQQDKKQSPKVSVVVTAYDLEKFLPETLESIKKQTLQDWECIIIDDASPDSCGAIADAFAEEDPRFKVIHNETNQYLSEARNTGMRASAGKYILPLDADDMLPPDALETLSSALDADRSVSIAYGNVLFLEGDGQTWHSGWPVPFQLDWQLTTRAGADRPQNLLPYSSMFRREVWERTGGYRRRCRTAEDADFWVRVASYGFRPVMVTRADTLIYRNRDSSMSRVQEPWNWLAWYPWAADKTLAPAGAVFDVTMPVPSLDPPLVSVIIPVGPGHEQLVMDAVDSVDAQTFRQWECIVVDDTGGTLDTDRFPAWVRVFGTAEAPRGVAAARNLGITHSRAACFVPLDADDILQPEALGFFYAAWRDYGGVIYSGFWDDNGGEVRMFMPQEYDAHDLRHGCIHAVTALYPKSAWAQVGGYDESLSAWEDWEFQLALSDVPVCGTLVALPLWTYRKTLGRRREENLANFEDSKQAILKKWASFWEGKDTMGCGGCSQRRAKIASDIVRKLAPPNNGSGDFILMEYMGAQQGEMTYRGAVSKAIYGFSARDRQKYVYKEDLPQFIGKVDFQIVPQQSGQAISTEPIISAMGPPAHKEQVTVA